MAFLEIDNASIGFGPHDNHYEVLTDVNLSVEENEFIAVVGSRVPENQPDFSARWSLDS